MSALSSTHFFHNWAKERIDEMDAALGSFEDKIGELHAELRVKANHALADLRKKRKEFQHAVEQQAKADEKARSSAKTQLEADWEQFESEVQKYVASFGKHSQQRIFERQAGAQLKAWREAAETFQTAAAGFAADRRREIDATVAHMKAEATAAEKKLETFHHAGTASQSALMHALAETRAVFDRANQSVREAFRKAAA